MTGSSEDLEGATDRFTVELPDGGVLSSGDGVEHREWGPMEVEKVSISAVGKRVRLKSVMRKDGLSIGLTEDELCEEWGETVAADPTELYDGGATTYEHNFGSKDGEVQITISVAGPEDRAEPVAAHLDDQAVRVLQAFENGRPPEEMGGKYRIDWGSVFEKIDGVPANRSLEDFDDAS